MATGCVDPPSNDLQTTANYDIRQLFKPSVLIDLEFHQSMTNMALGRTDEFIHIKATKRTGPCG